MENKPTKPIPACIPLPKMGGDEVFGRSRTTWLRWEKAGFIKLRRFKLPRSKRATPCTTCIPYVAAKQFIDSRDGFDLT